MLDVELFVTLLFTNCWTLVVKLMANRSGDDELKGIAHTYERPANARWSNPYRKINQLIIAAHAVSLISVIVLFFAGEYCMHEIFLILYILSWVYILDWPALVLIIIRENRRAMVWAKITNNKKRLTRKERREAEEELKRLLHHPLQWRKQVRLLRKERREAKKELKRLLHHPLQWRKQVRLYQKKRMEEEKEVKRLLRHPFQWRKMLEFYKRK